MDWDKDREITHELHHDQNSFKLQKINLIYCGLKMEWNSKKQKH